MLAHPGPPSDSLRTYSDLVDEHVRGTVAHVRLAPRRYRLDEAADHDEPSTRLGLERSDLLVGGSSELKGPEQVTRSVEQSNPPIALPLRGKVERVAADRHAEVDAALEPAAQSNVSAG